MLAGRREFVAGLFHDPQFGPIVMFGIGGVFTEALDDVVFRVAPLDENHAGQMIDELRSRKLLGPFRGRRRRSARNSSAPWSASLASGRIFRKSPRRTSTRFWSARTVG